MMFILEPVDNVQVRDVDDVQAFSDHRTVYGSDFKPWHLCGSPSSVQIFQIPNIPIKSLNYTQS